jgi:hypothetical protein
VCHGDVVLSRIDTTGAARQSSTPPDPPDLDAVSHDRRVDRTSAADHETAIHHRRSGGTMRHRNATITLAHRGEGLAVAAALDICPQIEQRRAGLDRFPGRPA